MATLDSAVEIIVRTDGAPVGRAGFSTAIIIDAAAMTERVLYFASPAEASASKLAGDITAAQETHILAGFSAGERPALIGAGRAAAEVAQVDTVTVAGVILDTEKFAIIIDGTTYEVTAVVPTDDATAIALKLATAINLGSDPVTAAPALGVVTLTADVAGVAFVATTTTDSAAATITRAAATPNGPLSTELDAILAADLVGWYGFQMVSRDADVIQHAAAWAETNQRFHMPQTSDADVKTSVTTDVASLLKAASYNYSKITWFSDDSKPAAFELLCDRLSVDPDVQTTIWDFVTLPGITPDVDSVTTTELANMKAKYCGVYLTLGGVGASGFGNFQCSGRKSDVQITVDWLRARLDEAHAQLLLNASNRGSKIPFTDLGFQQVAAVARAVYLKGIDAGHFVEAVDANGTSISPFITMPLRSSITDPELAARKLVYTSGALLAGAVELIKLTSDLTDDIATLTLLAGA